MKNETLHILSEIVARAALAKQLGQQQYGGDRNIYEALGYKNNILFSDYYARYIRQDIAKAIIDRPVDATWEGDIVISQPEQKEETQFEREWKTLQKELKLKNIFSRIDKLTGIGQYGVLLLGTDDLSSMEEFNQPLKPGKRKLIYVKPYHEDSADIKTFEQNLTNERYGKPLIYQINTTDAEGKTKSFDVHYSRIIHIVDNNLEGEVFGSSRLEPIFNRLMDIEKLTGGSAEMFWRGARPGLQGILDKDYQMTDTMIEDLQDQAKEFEHNLRRIFINEGVELKSLAPQISDPSTHIDIQIQMISAETRIPKRILTGSERGELSSRQDIEEWKTFIKSRRENFAELNIIRPFVDKMIEIGVLSKVEYEIVWPDLFAIGEKDKVEIGRIRSEALSKYGSDPIAQSIVSPEGFLNFFLGLSEEDIETITDMSNQYEPEIPEEEDV